MEPALHHQRRPPYLQFTCQRSLDKANESIDLLEQKTLALVLPRNILQQQQQIQQKPQEAAKARRKRYGAQAPVPAEPVVQEVRIHTDPKPVLTKIYHYVAGYFHVLVMASFVPFLVYFMLSWGGHVTETFLRVFSGEQRYAAARSWDGIGEATRAYILGNFFLWTVLSIASSGVFFFLGVPYWPR